MIDRCLRLLTLALICVLFALVVYTSHSPPKECPRDASLSVVRIETRYFDYFGEMEGCGSGIILNYRQVLTAWHVMEGAIDPVVCVYPLDGDDPIARMKCKVIAHDAVLDMALLEVEDDLPYAFCIIGLGAAADIKKYDPVWMVGASHYQNPHCRSKGEFICRNDHYEPFIYWIASVSLGRGQSGGAVFDKHGFLIGMILASDKTGSTCAFVSAYEISEFLTKVK